MYCFSGADPTKLYKEIIDTVIEDGDRVQPRGKLVAELRPASIEYKNPLNRVTFLPTRRINPFFQLAEALWILSGRADAPWLCKFNANMKTFSDDGENFNAPYGERIRRWGDNDAHGYKADGLDGVGALDQLYDVYLRFLNDKDTRQAAIAIGNPSFDNKKYLIDEQGKDICCNLYITFKIRDDKLHIVVFNRSNDVHWGTFGANLCQFSTIQEVLCSWLRNSGQEEFKNLEVGTYHQITDSLHIYLEDYGSDITSKINDYFEEHPGVSIDNLPFIFEEESRVNSSYEKFQGSLEYYWASLDKFITKDNITEQEIVSVLDWIDKSVEEGKLDSYIAFSAKAMLAYRLLKNKRHLQALEIIAELPNCQWKVSMVYFVKVFIEKIADTSVKEACVARRNEIIEDLKEALINKDSTKYLVDYLA